MSMAGIGKFLHNINELPGNRQGTVQAIQQASARTGVDFAYLMHKASVESSFNPQAKAKTSSATGLYQFTENTWLDMMDRHAASYGMADVAEVIQRDGNGRPMVADKAARQQILALRNSPQVSAVMAAELAAENAEALQAKVGGKIGATEMYMAHFLGAGGAGEFLQALKANPNAPAARLLPEAAAANHNVFYTSGGRARTVGEIYASFANKFKDTEVAEIAPPKAVAVAPPPAVDKTPVSTPSLQVLATITNDSIVADGHDAVGPMMVASAGSVSVPPAWSNDLSGVLDSGTQFNAMLVAQQMLDTATRTRDSGNDKGGDDKRRWQA